MTFMWRAYASRDVLAAGTEILVTGGHDRIRVQTADRISIETPNRHRLSVVVVDRTADQALLAAPGMPLVRLQVSAKTEKFDGVRLSDGFSRQGWVVQ